MVLPCRHSGLSNPPPHPCKHVAHWPLPGFQNPLNQDTGLFEKFNLVLSKNGAIPTISTSACVLGEFDSYLKEPAASPQGPGRQASPHLVAAPQVGVFPSTNSSRTITSSSRILFSLPSFVTNPVASLARAVPT